MRPSFRLLLLLSAVTLPPATADAARLRTMTSLTGPVVRLSDLFDDAGPNADRVLGPGPAPGGRIVVEAAQLAAIARQFGADWRPVSATERAVLDRPGKMLPREQVMDAVRAALETAGAPAQCDVDLPGLALPMVPLDSVAQAVATQMEYDAGSGRFTAVLSVTGADMTPITARIVGRAQETVDLPVAAGRLAAGAIVGPADLRTARVRLAPLQAEMARQPEQAIGKALRRAVAAGQPLPLGELQPPSLVQKGAIIMVQLDAPGLNLTGQGQALEAGAAGDRVRILNPSSRAVMMAVVTGPGQVRVEPGTMPITPAARGRTELAAQ